MFYFRAIYCSYVTSRDHIKHFDWLLLCMSRNLHRYVIIFDHLLKILSQIKQSRWPSARRSGRLKFNGHNSNLNVDLTFFVILSSVVWFCNGVTGSIKITVNTPTIKITHSAITHSIAHVNLHSSKQMRVPLS